jgi:hypothetical protein
VRNDTGAVSLVLQAPRKCLAGVAPPPSPQKPPKAGLRSGAIQDASAGIAPEPVVIFPSPSNEVAVLQALRLGGAERLEQIEGGGRVVTPSVHVGDPLFLAYVRTPGTP